MFTCPMHSEIEQATAGLCSKCRMPLVPITEARKKSTPMHSDRALKVLAWRSYIPLIVIISLILVTTLALSWNDYRAGVFAIENSTIYFMVGFFVTFAGFKLMDLKGFAEGYSTYDLLAQRWFGYGYIYPFIELAFGFLMLAGFHSALLLWTELAVMAFSGLGVAIKLSRREPFMCACLGTFLKVPLTYITLVEDFGMAALAFVLIIL